LDPLTGKLTPDGRVVRDPFPGNQIPQGRWVCDIKVMDCGFSFFGALILKYVIL